MIEKLPDSGYLKKDELFEKKLWRSGDRLYLCALNRTTPKKLGKFDWEKRNKFIDIAGDNKTRF